MQLLCNPLRAAAVAAVAAVAAAASVAAAAVAYEYSIAE